jgi:hypothetical protein
MFTLFAVDPERAKSYSSASPKKFARYSTQSSPFADRFNYEHSIRMRASKQVFFMTPCYTLLCQQLMDVGYR